MNITGTISRKAEIRTSQSGKQFVTFGIAVNESYKNKSGERVMQTTFFDCIDWRTTKIADRLLPGQAVELIGNISARAWVGLDGEPRAALNFKIDKIIFHGNGKTAVRMADAPDPIEVLAENLPF
jgi:single-strand DNA-binding protein